MRTNIFDMADAWTAAMASPTAIRMNVTDGGATGSPLLMDLLMGGASRFKVDKNGLVTSTLASGNYSFASGGDSAFGTYGPVIRSDGLVAWCATNNYVGTQDLKLSRIGAGILGVRAASVGAAIDFLEQTAPAAGAANTARLFAQDNGAGKTQIMVIFQSGAAQQVAIEP